MATESSSSEEYLSADEGNEEKSPDKSMRYINISLLRVVYIVLMLFPLQSLLYAFTYHL